MKPHTLPHFWTEPTRNSYGRAMLDTGDTVFRGPEMLNPASFESRLRDVAANPTNEDGPRAAVRIGLHLGRPLFAVPASL